MKIAMLMSVYGDRAVGGAERTAFELAKQLVERGHSVYILSLGPKGGPTPPSTVNQGVHCEYIALRQWYDPFHASPAAAQAHGTAQKIWRSVKKAVWHLTDIYNPLMAREVRKKLKMIKPDVFFTHTLQGFSVSAWNAANALNIKVLHMTHDHALICPGTAMTKGVKACEKVCTSCQFYSRLRHHVAVAPDAIVGPSEIILHRHRQFGWFENIAPQVAIPNALPANWPLISKDEIANLLRQDSSELTEPIVFGFLGRLDESKGADTIAQALCLLPKELKGRWRMRFAGAGTMDSIRQWVLAASLDGAKNWEELSPYIECLGLVQADSFLQTLHVLITPSRAHETFCNVVMEATSLGRPAIVSDRGALPERVQSGELGWIFPAGDASALSIQMRQLIDDPKQIYAKAQAAFEFRDQYDAKLQCDRFEVVLKDLLSA
jgi:glycosyltransferase involved in cell wall biosynthesis